MCSPSTRRIPTTARSARWRRRWQERCDDGDPRHRAEARRRGAVRGDRRVPRRAGLHLGNRRQVPQPTSRARRCRVVHRLRLSQGGYVMPVSGEKIPALRHDVSATTIVLGALASRDWRPMHHDHDFAVNRNGTRDIFLNTPNQAAWFERYLTDWTGPRGRLGRMRFRMKGSVFPGDTMVFLGTVTAVDVDHTGCGWAEVDVALR